MCIWQSTKHLFQIYIGCKHTALTQVRLCYHSSKLKRWRCKQILIKVKSESKRGRGDHSVRARHNQSHEPKHTKPPDLKASRRRKDEQES